ncbi:MAG: DNA-3-methyladenine glycosylase [Bacteroidota bacterium]|nr:DNA-3-methyladenine glycosylase [Bacteroidota bacterium]
MNAITLWESDKLPEDFYRRSNTPLIAKQLLGKVLISNIDGVLTAGRIIETEAYHGKNDKASHAYQGRRTARTEVMFEEGGVAYVYLCYGIHQLFNVVTGEKEMPAAVLIRALEPLVGMDTMLHRLQKPAVDHSLTRGPGNLSRALGIHKKHSGISLQGKELFIADDGFRTSESAIGITPRIGVDYAGEDAARPYRFIIKNNPWLSGKKRINQLV